MIRELRQEDREVFLEMCKKFYQSSAVLHGIPTANMEETFRRVVAGSPYAQGYLLTHQGETAGYLLTSTTYSNEVGGLVIWLEELYLEEKFRGLGLGGAAMEYIRQNCPADVRRLRLEVTPCNQGAIRLYERKGYEKLDYIQMVQDF